MMHSSTTFRWLFAISLVLLFSCSEDEPAPDLIGLWKINEHEASQRTEYQNSPPLEFNLFFSPGSPGGILSTSRLNFEPDNTGLYSRDNLGFEDNGTYQITWQKDTDKLTIKLDDEPEEVWTILSLTHQELVLYYERETTTFPDNEGVANPKTYRKTTHKHTFIR